MSLEQRELQAQFYEELGQVYAAAGDFEAAYYALRRAKAIMHAVDVERRRRERHVEHVPLTPEICDLWARAFADRPTVARTCRNKARELRYDNARVGLPLADIRAIVTSAARPRERRDGSRSSARSGDSGEDGSSDEPPAAPRGVAA